MQTITSPRLILRPVQAGDLAALCAVLGDASTTQYLFAGHAMDAAATQAFVAAHFTTEDAPTGMGILVEKNTGTFAGFAGVIPTTCLGQHDCEFGFVIAAPCRGRGYATEIGLRQMAYGFTALDLPRMLALAHPANHASVTVLEQHLGMTRVTTLAATAERGPRIVFCRARDQGLPALPHTARDHRPPR